MPSKKSERAFVARLFIDDAAPAALRRDSEVTCVDLTGFDPSRIVDITTRFKQVTVVSRNGTRALAERTVAKLRDFGVPEDRIATTRPPSPGWEALHSTEDDLSLAVRFLTEHRHELRYVADVERWITWNGIYWRGLYDKTGMARAKALLQRFLAKTGREVAGRMISEEAEREGSDRDSRDVVRKVALKVEGAFRSSTRLNAVWSHTEVTAQDSDVVTLQQVDLNRDPALLNCTSGLIDLRTGELRPHDPDELCTAVCPVSYDPSVAPLAPTFTRFLTEVQPEPEMRSYLRRLAGLFAYGGQRTHVFPIWLGNDGRNGKGLLADVLRYVLGDYAGMARSEILLINRNEKHATILASLVHRRFVWVDETRSTRSLDGAQVKSLTGGAPIRANFMRRDEFTFLPMFTLLLTTNQMPRFEGSDRALGSRLEISPWDISFAGREDEDLPDKVKAEAEAILHWIVAGAIEYLADGLQPPEMVTEMTLEERVEHDPEGRWFGEHLTSLAGVAGTVVYTAWLRDRYIEGLSLSFPVGVPPTPRAFEMRLSSWLGEQGWPVKKVRHAIDGTRWRGWEGLGWVE